MLTDGQMEELLARDLTEEEMKTLPSGLLQFREELLAARRKTEVKKHVEQLGIVSPFYKKIDDFFVTAIILQFVGYRDELQKLMHRLNYSTRKYFQSEETRSLRMVLQDYQPQTSNLLEFGFGWYQWSTSHDQKEYLNRIPRYKRVKLKAINFKHVYG